MWLYLSGSDQSVIAKSTITVSLCFYPEYPMDVWNLHQYGMIYGHSGVIFSEGQSTSFMEEVHARTSALQGMEKAWQESEAAWYSRSFAWPKKSSLRSYSLKMSQTFDAGGGLTCCEKLPNWGMTFGFALYPLHPLERLTKEIDGSCLPTPMAQEAGRSYNQHMAMKAKMGRKTCSSLSDFVEGLLPTPRAGHTGNITMGRLKDKNQNLERVLAERLYLPTPKASEVMRSGAKSESNRDNPSLWYVILKATGKKLNVLFVEWMMEYPIGWTELSPWATAWLKAKRKKHSKS